jgi:hypothetical protein
MASVRPIGRGAKVGWRWSQGAGASARRGSSWSGGEWSGAAVCTLSRSILGEVQRRYLNAASRRSCYGRPREWRLLTGMAVRPVGAEALNPPWGNCGSADVGHRLVKHLGICEVQGLPGLPRGSPGAPRGSQGLLTPGELRAAVPSRRVPALEVGVHCAPVPPKHHLGVATTSASDTRTYWPW